MTARSSGNYTESDKPDKGYDREAIDLGLDGTSFYLKADGSGLAALGYLDDRIALLILVKKSGVRRLARRVLIEDSHGVSLASLSRQAISMLEDADIAGVATDEGPGEGVTTALLRSVPLQTLLRTVEGHEATLERSFGVDLPRDIKIVVGDAITQNFKSVRDLKAHVRWASAAHIYAGLVATGHRAPSKRTAELLKISPDEARNRIARARSRSYLSPVPHGRAGGEVTQKGIDLLVAVGAVPDTEED